LLEKSATLPSALVESASASSAFCLAVSAVSGGMVRAQPSRPVRSASAVLIEATSGKRATMARMSTALSSASFFAPSSEPLHAICA